MTSIESLCILLTHDVHYSGQTFNSLRIKYIAKKKAIGMIFHLFKTEKIKNVLKKYYFVI